MPDKSQTTALVDAMWQLLDDMGENGLCVCKAAKAQARIAIEPFITDAGDSHGLMTMDDATQVMKEVASAN